MASDLRVGDAVRYKDRKLSVSDLIGEIAKVYKTKPGICKVRWDDGLTRDDEMDGLERVDTV